MSITTEYKSAGLKEAIEQSKKAREKWQKAKTIKAKREAEEELLFWQIKAAFFENVKR